MTASTDLLGESERALLARIVAAPGVPGREEEIRALLESEVRKPGLFDDVRTDDLGSLICVRNPRGARVPERPLRVLVAAHMDRIGFLVSHISAGGFLRLHPVGSFDPRTLFARRVSVITQDGARLPGILNPEGRPHHTAPAEELGKVPPLDQFFVDLSLPENSVRTQVALGDMVLFDSPVRWVGEGLSGPGLDDRVGCWALLSAIDQLGEHGCEIHAAWTSQEEVGSRGAQALSFGVDADIGIACDTNVCCDLPGTPEEHHVMKAGGGVGLQIADSSTLSDMGLVRDLEAVARRHGIACQRTLMLGGGQDGARIQLSREGVRTVVLSCPIRYLHTDAELAQLVDIVSYRDLLRCYLETL